MSNDPVKDDGELVVERTAAGNTCTWRELKARKLTPEQIEESERWAHDEAQRLARIESVQLIESAQLPSTVQVIQPATQTTREKFIEAIKQRRYLEIGYVPSNGDARHAIVAPLDFGPSRKATDKSDRYHMWDMKRKHVLSILPTQLLVLTLPTCEPENTTFNPEDIVTWCTKKSPWFVQRDWGSKS